MAEEAGQVKGNQKSLGWCRSDQLLRRLQLGLRRHSNRLQLLGVSLSPQNPTARLGILGQTQPKGHLPEPSIPNLRGLFSRAKVLANLSNLNSPRLSGGNWSHPDQNPVAGLACLHRGLHSQDPSSPHFPGKSRYFTRQRLH